MIKTIKEHLIATFDTFFPRLCCACSKPLLRAENVICLDCDLNLPRADNYNDKNSKLNKKFWGRVSLEGVVAYYVFQKGSKVQHLVHQLKYKGKQEIGILIGNYLGALLRSEDSIIKNIDLIIPIPLHHKKLKIRGYNQCDSFAIGLSENMKVPLSTNAIERVTANNSQTTQKRFDRWGNVAELFVVKDIEQLRSKHILLVDDVITTGSTAESCIKILSEVPNIKISFAAIAYVSR